MTTKKRKSPGNGFGNSRVSKEEKPSLLSPSTKQEVLASAVEVTIDPPLPTTFEGLFVDIEDNLLDVVSKLDPGSLIVRQLQTLKGQLLESPVLLTNNQVFQKVQMISKYSKQISLDVKHLRNLAASVRSDIARILDETTK